MSRYRPNAQVAALFRQHPYAMEMENGVNELVRRCRIVRVIPKNAIWHPNDSELKAKEDSDV